MYTLISKWGAILLPSILGLSCITLFDLDLPHFSFIGMLFIMVLGAACIIVIFDAQKGTKKVIANHFTGSVKSNWKMLSVGLLDGLVIASLLLMYLLEPSVPTTESEKPYVIATFSSDTNKRLESNGSMSDTNVLPSPKNASAEKTQTQKNPRKQFIYGGAVPMYRWLEYPTALGVFGYVNEEKISDSKIERLAPSQYVSPYDHRKYNALTNEKLPSFYSLFEQEAPEPEKPDAASFLSLLTRTADAIPLLSMILGTIVFISVAIRFVLLLPHRHAK